MAANWAKTQFVKLLSNERKAAEEGLNSLLRMDDEIARNFSSVSAQTRSFLGFRLSCPPWFTIFSTMNAGLM